MTTESRKRFRFLQHVPLSTCVQLIEVELKPPMISDEVARSFSSQINERKRRRSERVRHEKRRERLQLEAERRQKPQHPKIESMKDFPTCGADEDEMLEKALKASLALEPPADHGRIAEEDYEHHESEAGNEHGSGIEIPQPSTSRFGLGHDGFPEFPMSTSPSMSFAQACTSSPPNRPVWKKSPTYPLTTGAHSGQSLRRVASEPEPDGSASASSVRASISDAIAHAFANLAETPEATTTDGESTGNGQKKKKKKKGKVLYTTGMGI